MFTLFEAFKSINNEEDFNNFLIDLCTPDEIKDLQNRFEIAQLLKEGQFSQRNIAEKIKCSITTVTRVARFLNQEKYGGYRSVLNNLEVNKNQNHHRQAVCK